VDEATIQFIHSCLDASFPDGGARLIDATEIPLGFNALWRLRVEHDGISLDLVLRRYTHWLTWHASDDREKAAREAAALEHARAHGLPVPALYGHGPDWTLVAHVDGRRLLPLDPGVELDARPARSLAALLARLHALPLPEGPFPRVSTATSLRIIRERAASAGDARLSAAVERLRPLDDGAPVFVHGDPHPGNALFDDEFAVAGLIDWEDAAIADCRFDVAMAYWWMLERTPGIAGEFIAAYEAATGHPVRDLPRWLAFATVRAWAVGATLRAAGHALALFSTEEEMAEAERRLAACGW
jgi:aminoglycoside phosphotransferase (APT) family kinase protein